MSHLISLYYLSFKIFRAINRNFEDWSAFLTLFDALLSRIPYLDGRYKQDANVNFISFVMYSRSRFNNNYQKQSNYSKPWPSLVSLRLSVKAKACIGAFFYLRDWTIIETPIRECLPTLTFPLSLFNVRNGCLELFSRKCSRGHSSWIS